ncbi:MAG: hypothetical protein ACTS2F_28560 [Thainema sp.]
MTNLPDNQVRIAITGTDAATGLTVSVTPGDPTAQTPDDDSIQISVTGEPAYLCLGLPGPIGTELYLEELQEQLLPEN